MAEIPAFEDYLKKYAVYVILALALGILSVYVSRETSLKEENTQLKSELTGATEQLTSMETQYRSMEDQVRKSQETHKTVVIKTAVDGSKTEQWEEVTKNMEDSYHNVIQHQQEIITQLEQKVSELQSAHNGEKVEIVRNAPKFALLAEYHYDGLTWIDRLRVGAGLNLGAWTVGATAQIKQEFNPALDVAFRF